MTDPTRRLTRPTMRVGVALALVGLPLAATSALADPRPAQSNPRHSYLAEHVVPISGRSPFPQGCPKAVGDADHLPGSEIEPMITVNPRHPSNVIATWQQDLGAAGRVDMVGVTQNGGRTWRSVVMSGTKCTGGSGDAASDPWVSAGPRGSMYFGGATALLSTDPPAVRMVAAHSSDRGQTWSRVSSVSATSHRNDKPSIAADPRHAMRAYMVWANRDIPVTIPSHSFLRFSRTSDAARTWSPPTVVDHAPPNAIDVSSEVLVLPHGSLITLFSRVAVAADGSFLSQLWVTRSTDHGTRWTPAALVTSHPLPPPVIDPTGQELDSQDLSIHSAAVGRDGVVYVAWDSSTSLRRGAVKMISSRDGGRRWTHPRSLPGITSFAMEPAVAAGARGSVGVLWYDVRNDRPRDISLTTDVWFAHSPDHGFHWRQTHVAGPFDMRRAPLHRLGEYQGLAAMGRCRFAAAFTQAKPKSQHGLSDIFFAKMRPARHRPCGAP